MAKIRCPHVGCDAVYAWGGRDTSLGYVRKRSEKFGWSTRVVLISGQPVTQSRCPKHKEQGNG